jgi:hypothetical protein
MFPSAIISKNRNRRAYNVAFAGKQFCGDSTNWIPPDHKDMYPGSIINHGSSLLLFQRHVPRCFWPYIIASYESGRWNHGYWYSNQDRPSPEYVESVEKSLKADRYASYTPKALEECLNQLMEFKRLYEVSDDGARKTISLSEYGFSFYYGPEAYTRYQRRHYYHGDSSTEETKIVRRFHEPSPTLTVLESLSKSLKIYKMIKRRYESTLKFMSMFRGALYNDLSRVVRQIEENEDQLRKPREAIQQAIGKVLDDKFGTHFYKDPPKEMKIEGPTERVAEVAGAIYNIDTVQDEFNQWLENRRQD